jgi:signal transduction histidine kinase
VSLLGFVISFPIGVFMAVLTQVSSTDSPRTFITWIGIGTIAQLVSGLVLFVADQTWLKDRRVEPAAISLVVFTSILSLSVRVPFFMWGDNLTEAVDGVSLLERLSTSLVLGAIWYTTIAYVLDAVDRFNQQRQLLMSTWINEELAVIRQTAIVEVLRSTLVGKANADVKASVAQARSKLDEIALATDSSSAQDLVRELSANSDERLRAVSHQLWHRASNTSRLTFIGVIRAIAKSQPYRTWLVLLTTALPAGLIILRTASIAGLLEILVPWILYILLVTSTTNFFCRRYPRQATKIYVSSFGFLALSGAIVYLQGLNTQLDFPVVSWVLMAEVGAVVVIPFANSGTGISREQQSILAALRASVTDSELQRLAMTQESTQISREISTYLHGTLRANITAAALRLQSSIVSGDPDQVSEALAHARIALDQELAESLGTEPKDVVQTLTNFANGWAGLVDISVTASCPVPPALDRQVSEIVIEAVNNAIRHGDAQIIKVEISESANQVLIRVENDGSLTTPNSPGLGTATLDLYAPGTWKRRSLENGNTVLEAHLAY